ncbi:hypothetical protein M0R72_14635 [Candidatus Pacearchaeota archaeon]|jgi:hypothetical protein|nr:hypothetical protein [Candidatus Pacearchaeota archaeon]
MTQNASIFIYRSKINQLLEDRRRAQQSINKEEEAKADLDIQITNATQANQIIQTIAQTLQQQCHQQISSIVTKCLNAVFEDPYEFEIQFNQKRGKTEAILVFTRDGIELDDPLNEIGGGVVDVAALALRLACILIQRPTVRRLVVMDEPFKCIRGQDNRNRTRSMLQRLATELDIQFILCTDIKNFKLGTVIDMG